MEKTVERKKSDEISLYITPIHVHNTLGDTTPTHSYTKLSKFHPHADPFHNFHSQRKLTHFTICVNSHSHTHEHKITSTHTPIYNPHAPRAYFRAKSKRERRGLDLEPQPVFAVANGAGKGAWKVRPWRANWAIRCWVGLARPI